MSTSSISNDQLDQFCASTTFQPLFKFCALTAPACVVQGPVCGYARSRLSARCASGEYRHKPSTTRFAHPDTSTPESGCFTAAERYQPSGDLSSRRAYCRWFNRCRPFRPTSLMQRFSAPGVIARQRRTGGTRRRAVSGIEGQLTFD